MEQKIIDCWKIVKSMILYYYKQKMTLQIASNIHYSNILLPNLLIILPPFLIISIIILHLLPLSLILFNILFLFLPLFIILLIIFFLFFLFRYFDAAPGSVSLSNQGDNDMIDRSTEIDTDEADNDDFLTFAANPR